MFCGKCGSPMDDNAMFCPNCGSAAGNQEAASAPAAATEYYAETEILMPAEQNNQQYSQPYAPAYSEPEAPAFALNTEGAESKPKKKKSKAPILIAAIVAVVAAALLVVLNWNNVSGFVERTFSSPEKLQASVYEDAVGQVFDTVTGSNSENKEQTQIDFSNLGVEGELRVSVDKQILDMIPAQGMDLGFLSNIALGYDLSVKDALGKLVLDVILGDTTIASADAILNSDTLELYASVPELNDQALYLNLKEMIEENMGYSAMGSFDPEMLATLKKVIPSEEVLRTIAARYVSLVMSGFGEVEKSNEKMEVADISQKLHVLEATMDEDDLLKIAETLIKTLKKDKEIEAIIANVEEAAGQEGLYDAFVEAMEKAEAELSEIDSDDMPSFKLTLVTYLNDTNDIVGMTAKLSAEGEKLEPFSWIRVEQGKKFASEMVISAGTESVVIEGSGENGDSTNAEYVLSVAGEEILTVSVKDYVDNDQQISGTVRIAPSDAILDNVMSNMNDVVSGLLGSADPSLEIKFFKNADKVELAVGLAVGSKNLLAVSTSATLTAPDDIAVPENYVEISEDSDPSQWLETMNPEFLETLMDRLIEAGVPAELFVMG